MRLARKLILLMVVGLSLVMLASGYLRLLSELAAFDEDMTRDHDVLARVLGSTIPQLWVDKGRAAALGFIDEIEAPSRALHIRWVDRDALPKRPPVDDLRRTDVPITVNGVLEGAVEISESQEFARSFARNTLLRTVVLTLVAIAAAAGLSTILGVWFVGRPMSELVAQARRIGAGDMSHPLSIHQRDEIGELAAEMNAMCLHLAETRYALTAETEARLRAQDQLRHADRLATVGKLASGIAHELGTPLGVALMRANILTANPSLGRDVRDAARIISEQIDRITGIVRQLLDFARGRGSAPGGLSRRKACNLVRVAERSVTMLQPLAVKRSLVMEVVHDGETPEPVANEEQIQQVLVNLIVNAIHASDRPGKVIVDIGRDDRAPPADVTPPVWSKGSEPQYARVSVKDEGTGINPDILPRIFEPFFTTKRVGEGTGLGLSVAYGIVREHGGWIEVTSERNKGSCFSVYLPLEHAEVETEISVWAQPR